MSTPPRNPQNDPPPPGGFGADAVSRAEAALAALSDQFDAWIEADLLRIEAAHARLIAEPGPRHLDALHTSVHDLKGLAATYGHPLAGRAAASLERLIDPLLRAQHPPSEPIAAHVSALRTLVELRTGDETHPVGVRICEALERSVGPRD